MKTTLKYTVLSTVLSGVVLTAAFSPVMAQTVTPTTREMKKAEAEQNRIPALKTKGDTEIAKRITSLNAAITRINSAKKLSDTQKQTLVTNDQNTITTLNNLKAKIDADTDFSTLRSDVKSIFNSVRVYMLVLPQEGVTRAADATLEVTSNLSALADKLATRISDAQSKGHDVTTLQASLTEMKAKTADATTQANNAVNGVVNLKPDLGNATVEASNKQALQTAKAAIEAAKADITTAYNDAKSIVVALKTMQ